MFIKGINFPPEADWSFSSFIRKLEKKNNPENPVILSKKIK